MDIHGKTGQTSAMYVCMYVYQVNNIVSILKVWQLVVFIIFSFFFSLKPMKNSYSILVRGLAP